ncbi:ABC transporter substrate-binding protein [Alkalihalobacillus trypoxylicola]|uniref:Cobalamin-binding protein n=1 Tax=Alkalihalobacillus trypoxylicola TaxID=519424 RepID=A0A161PBS7_9BACI|nr:ABC transporter substrate-binding protein [Alkalihalobacillus trypoxylicola]KYG29239.1 cobalamin-binding protein [Alkalihalobacillus trypoxylicola]
MIIRSFKKWLPIFAVVFLLAACQENEQVVEEGYTVVDDMGEEISFDEVPETVISLAPSNTEILFELGVGEKVIGVTTSDNYPEEVLEIDHVSDSITIDAEAIIALEPDVVFAYTVGAKESIEPLLNAGITVFVIESASTFEDVYGDIMQIAEVMGVKETGEELVADIQAQVQDVVDKTEELEEKRQVYFEISAAPDIFTVGNHTFQEVMIKNAGLDNVFADEDGWIPATEEEVIVRNPNLIVTTVNYIEEPLEEIMNRAGWSDIEAIKNEEVFLLDADILSRPGPRIGEAVELLAEVAYPELFQ